MLDCSRTFLNKAYLFRYIDLLAMHKMNVLHLHLTDDQGWRIEIKKHPRLTEIGSRFASRYAGEKNGYYSQQDIREIVHYAALRHVTIVPEIEMPGHATALLAVYPELSCSGRRQDIFPFFQGPAVTRDILCAGNDAVFDVMKDVLAEVMELFPSQYIHVGGDEAPKDRWQACPKCRQRIKEEGLHNEDELQSYFMRRIGDFVRSKGRTLIGWDEILEGGLAPNAAVMSWRGTKGGYEAAILNHEVVMSPTTHCYFDYDVRQISLDKTYAFCPIPEGLPEEKTRFILGGQANMWTHIARTDSTIDQQIFPRLLALAEALWSKPEQKRFKDFYHRYKSYEQRLHLLGVAVGPAAEPIILQPQMDSLAHRISCRLDVHLPDLRVYYTLNGDLPTRDSRMYKTPFVFEANTTLKAQAFIDEKPYGAMLEKAYTQHLATGRKVTFSSPLCRRYPGSHEYALTDGWSGSLNQRDGFWLGVETTDLQATVDLERVEQLGSIRMNFLSKSSARIFAPMEVLFSVSTDGRVFKTVYRIENEIRKSWKEDAIWTAQAEQLDVPARYVNILAKNVKTVPLWHPGAGAPAFILADELILTAAAVN
jgi:hexosaminidase